MEGVCKPGQSDPKIGNPTAPRACVPLPSCSPASVQIKGGQCPGSRGGAQEAGRAAPRNSGCGQAAGARDAKPAATAEQPSGRPTFAPPCVLRGSAAGRRPNPCSRVASARLAGHKVRSTAVRGPRPRRRRRHRHRSCQHEMSESRQTHVTLHDIDPQALDQLVQFAYTAEIVVGEGNVQTLLPAASLLQLNGVRDACCKFLLSQLDPSNCLGIRGFADTHSCSDLLKAAHRYVLQHFVDVAKTEEFMLLPLKQVMCQLGHSLDPDLDPNPEPIPGPQKQPWPPGPLRPGPLPFNLYPHPLAHVPAPPPVSCARSPLSNPSQAPTFDP
uniref:BTB domain-containing protein n=1 Tax=Sus scrofa TaxID=9823 RepID=A0A8D1LT49_PIG